MVNPVIGGVYVAGLCFGACGIKLLRTQLEKKVTSIAFDVFASIAIVTVAALHFQIAIIPNILMLAIAAMSQLILMQMVNVFAQTNEFKREKI